MSLASGVRLGPYEITAPVGAGGMGAREATGVTVMAADVRADASKFEVGIPRALFKTTLDAPGLGSQGPGTISDSYAVSADGQRFLGLVPAGQLVAEPITVVLNWASGLKR